MQISATSDLWWKNAVVYCIDVETFADGNGDGIGDFAGLTQRIDYLSGLGVTCVWLLPFYPSPRRDDGYDISDFYGVDPRFGTLGDFVDFVRTAGDRGIRVLVDFVPNHTSDQHPWFQAARSDPASPYHDWYVWADERPPEDPAGVAFPDREKSTWAYDRKAKKWYLHHFYSFQPELDTDNPAVRAEFERILSFWLQLGVAGFRIDAVPFFLEQDEVGGDHRDHHEHLKSLRAYVSRRKGDALLLGEVNVGAKQLSDFFGGAAGDELHMLFAFPVMASLWLSIARNDTSPLVHALERLPDPPSTGHYAHFLRVHDELTLDRLTRSEIDEVFAAFAPDPSMQLYGHGIRRRLAAMLDGDEARIRCLNSLLFSLPGTPMVFYGDEIGLGDDLSLPDRVAVRVPMQWSARENAGFSVAPPDELVRPVHATGAFGYRKINVSAQRRNPESLLNWFERLIRTRRETPELGWGKLSILPVDAPPVIAHRADWDEATVIAVHNLSGEPAPCELKVEGLGRDAEYEEILSDGAYDPLQSGDNAFTIRPWGYRWVRIHRPRQALKAAPPPAS